MDLPLPDVLKKAVEEQDDMIGPKLPPGGITGMATGQQGGYVTMQGFIKQSLENMYGRN